MTEQDERIKAFRKKVKVDRFSLDTECAEQAYLFVEVAEMYADAEKAKKEAEAAYDDAVAEKDLDIRRSPEGYGLDEEPKEKAIAHTVRQQAKVKRLREEMFEAIRKCNKLKSLKDGFEQKKIMLRVCGDLWLGEYYSETEVRKSEVGKFRKRMSTRKS